MLATQKSATTKAKEFSFNISNIKDLKTSDRCVNYVITNKQYETYYDMHLKDSFDLSEDIIRLAEKNRTLQKIIKMEKDALKELKEKTASFKIELAQYHKEYGKNINLWFFSHENRNGQIIKPIEVNLIITGVLSSKKRILKEKRTTMEVTKLEKWKADTEFILKQMFYKMTKVEINENEGKPWCEAAEFYTFDEKKCIFVRNDDVFKKMLEKRTNTKKKDYPATISTFKTAKSFHGEEAASLDGGIVLLARSQINRALNNDRSSTEDSISFCTGYKDTKRFKAEHVNHVDSNVWYCDDDTKEFWKVKHSESLNLAYKIEQHVKSCKCECTRCCAVKTLNPDMTGWEGALLLVKKWKTLDYIMGDNSSCHVSYISAFLKCTCNFN